MEDKSSGSSSSESSSRSSSEIITESSSEVGNGPNRLFISLLLGLAGLLILGVIAAGLVFATQQMAKPAGSPTARVVAPGTLVALTTATSENVPTLVPVIVGPGTPGSTTGSGTPGSGSTTGSGTPGSGGTGSGTVIPTLPPGGAGVTVIPVGPITGTVFPTMTIVVTGTRVVTPTAIVTGTRVVTPTAIVTGTRVLTPTTVVTGTRVVTGTVVPGGGTPAGGQLPQTGMGNEWLLLLAAALLVALIYVVRRMRTSRT